MATHINKYLILTIMTNVANPSMNQESPEVRVVRAWRNNRTSSTILFSIPSKLAKRYHITDSTNLLVIPTDEGILLKKLEMRDIE